MTIDAPRPKLLFASGNPTKHLIYRPLLQKMGFDVVDLSQAEDIRVDKPIENAPTVTENALIKAEHYQCDAYPYVFAHDVGLCFDALNDEPGVQARRWAGKLSENISDEDWMAYLLDRMKDVPDMQRTGRFIVGWAVTDGVQTHTLYQESPFEIAQGPLRPMTAGSPMTALIHGGEDVIAHRQAVFDSALASWAPLRRLVGSKSVL
jgi:inosine/xanthosine triphosphate pyrophosphatase family protein